MADDPNVPVQAEAEINADNAELNAIAIDDFAAIVYLTAPEADQTQKVLLPIGCVIHINQANHP
jgi:hypothetical protein